MKRVCIDGRMVDSGGIGTYLRELVPRVAQALPYVRFTVLGPPGGWRPWVGGLGNVVVRDAFSRIYSFQQQLEIPRLVSKETDLLWVPHFDLPVFVRVPRLVTLHDVFHLAHPEKVGGAIKRAYAVWMYRHAVRSASTILTVSAFTATEIRRLVPGPHPPIVVIPNGVDLARWVRPVDAELGDETPPYAVFVGNVKPHKNVHGLLEALRTVREVAPELHLKVVGRREGFITPATQLTLDGIEDRVEFTGHVEDAELVRIIARARLLVLPSFYEGFGLPPLEAMAVGTPVVVALAASLPEVCGDAAEFCDPHSPTSIARAIVRVHRDEARRSELIRRGLERVQRFHWGIAAEHTARVIEDLLTTRDPPSVGDSRLRAG